MYWPAKLELFVTCHLHADIALQSLQADSGSSKGEAEIAIPRDEGFHFFFHLYRCIALICIFFPTQQPPRKASKKPMMV